jgi:hypothetical protein
VKNIGMVRIWTEVSLIPFLGLEDKTLTCDRPYKFSLK